MTEGLVYVGRVVSLDAIPDADNIVSAIVICGQGGKWRGVVRKVEYDVGDVCEVYLPDSLVSEDDPRMIFMKASNWRVKMRRFRGAPSEVVIMPAAIGYEAFVGLDITEIRKVVKYCKPIPANLQGEAKGLFPVFIPKTDESNYQSNSDLVDRLVGNPYYISEKADGSSTTAYRYKGEFGLCSRNLELKRNPDNGYWKVAIKYGLEELLPDGIALQWETCGPKIQNNPMGLKEIDGRAFSAYSITEHRYLNLKELECLCNNNLSFPMCPILDRGDSFSREGVELLGEGTYANGKQREGVVVRSQNNIVGAFMPISFKVINLGYET